MTRGPGALPAFGDWFRSRPCGRPKCERQAPSPPLSAISVIAGAARSIRVESVTMPFSTGTLRSTRTKMRLPFTSTWSRVRNAVMSRPGARMSEQFAHRYGGVRHAVGESPFVVIPGHHAHEGAVHDLGLVHVEDRGARIVIEVERDVGIVGVAKDALELLFGGALDRAVHFILAGRLFGDELEIDHRDIWRWHAD